MTEPFSPSQPAEVLPVWTQTWALQYGGGVNPACHAIGMLTEVQVSLPSLCGQEPPLGSQGDSIAQLTSKKVNIIPWLPLP